MKFEINDKVTYRTGGDTIHTGTVIGFSEDGWPRVYWNSQITTCVRPDILIKIEEIKEEDA